MKYMITLFLVLGLLTACGKKQSAHPSDFQITRHDLSIRIQPNQHLAKIIDNLSFDAREPMNSLQVELNQDAEIEEIRSGAEQLEYRIVPTAHQQEKKGIKTLQIDLPEPWQHGTLSLRYSLTANDSVDKAAFSREYIAYQVKKYIGKKGVFLSPSARWYAGVDGDLPRFAIQAFIPDSFNLITQGKLAGDTVEEGMRKVVWRVEYPTDGIHLVGAKYQIESSRYQNVDIYTYFFPQTRDLAPRYLNACQRYIAMYSQLIAPYPFSKFAVVENFFPTGYGMPSYTLLGSQVLRLPFIIYTSLGHEICHNWWGNSVYVDYDSGNWCEGLTTYFADYHYKEMRSPQAASEYRRDLDRDFTVYVKKGKDFPLSRFTERTESASRAIGYGKSAMTFHQLRRIIGDSLFYQSFRKFYADNKFRKASWADIEKAVDSTSQMNLSWFFDQWVNRTGAPGIKLLNVQQQDSIIVFTLAQEKPAFRLYLPVQLVTDRMDTTQYFWFDKEQQTFQIAAPGVPQKLAVDPAYDVFRKLDRREIPPTLSELFAQEKAIVVLPDQCPPEKLPAYRQFAEMLAEGEKNISIRQASELSEAEIANNSLYLLGTLTENSLWQKVEPDSQKEVAFRDNQIYLNDEKVPDADGLAILTFRDRKQPGRNICLVALGGNLQIGRVGMLMKHYGKYSYLVFEKGRNRVKGIYAVQNNPLIYWFASR